jgi:uncharacterized membrane protein
MANTTKTLVAVIVALSIALVLTLVVTLGGGGSVKLYEARANGLRLAQRCWERAWDDEN